MLKIKINNKLTIRNDLLGVKDLIKLAEEELSNTNLRLTKNLMKGLDTNGKPLKKYSKSYSRSIRAGKVPGKDITTVNMTQRGTLLRSKTVSKISTGAELKFVGGHRSGMSSDTLASIQLKRRPKWHSLGKEDIKRIQKRLDKFAANLARKLIR